MSDVFIQAEQRVSPVELFFDLVFGFAFTQVTTFWVEHDSWSGVGQGLLVLATLWWVWASFAWLTNTANTEADLVLAVVVVATAGVFVAALAVPETFTGHRLIFGISILAVLVAFVGLYAEVSRGLPDQLAAVLRMARTALPAAALILGAAFVPTGVRSALWGVAIVVGFVGPNQGGLGGWRIFPAHFAERHGLILIIAIGESLSAVGFAARGTHLDAAEVGAAVLGLAVAAAFWLAYFDFASGGIRSLLEKSHGTERVALARDAYTYMHLPMVAGILLFAFAVRTALVHPGSDLEIVPAVALCCGSALYLLAFVGLRWRASRRLGIGRPIAAVTFVLVTPAARFLPAVAGLGLIASVWLGLHAYELVHWREARALRRSLEAPS
ncbi:MAG TPA: low temperature requirement protein A [Acidimicrobiales bacterium]